MHAIPEGSADAHEIAISTFTDGDGALPGDYKVLVVPPQAIPFVSDQKGMSLAEGMALYQKGLAELKNKPPPFGADIPPRYSDPYKTPLRQHVPPDGKVTIALQSEGGASPKTRAKVAAFADAVLAGDVRWEEILRKRADRDEKGLFAVATAVGCGRRGLRCASRFCNAGVRRSALCRSLRLARAKRMAS